MCLQKHRHEFEELTGITVGDEQMPEQQQRPKVALEMASGHPSFDVVNIAMHVQKRLIEKAKWMEDLRPYLSDATLTAADFDPADFSPGGYACRDRRGRQAECTAAEPGPFHPVLQPSALGR